MKRFKISLRVVLSSAVLVTALAMATSLASAAPTLYHSPGGTGIDPSTTPNLPLGTTETIHLYFNPGTIATDNGNPICNGGAGGPGGNGDESCGIHFKIAVTGDLSILSYSPIVGISAYYNTGSELDASLVTTDPLDILQVGPTKIGTLVLDVSGAQGGLGSVTFLQSVDADLELVPGIGRDVFFVPEPAVALQLAIGALGLAVLDRRRALRG